MHENNAYFLYLRTKLYKIFDKPNMFEVFFVFLHIEMELKIE
ncbi:hypothetical protein PREVCOP_04211 [Segatella copri DSM 18205]|uniref:Uncharacterized protein n=1 Tax=Segatella copri DSM 18205 TaxID=537011 RepID=D1PAI6_9BACT|nr:hypothetical protein PREVCOP_04211 [Segatella copri DSM 18205]